MIQQKVELAGFMPQLFSDRVAMAWASPRAPMPRLMGDEVLSVEQVSPARAREFGAGRAAARAAMEMLGQIPRPILQGEDRAPIWPVGLTGSITHTARDCLAVVTDDPDIAGLGLDLEPVGALEPALWPVICTPGELAWLATLGPSQRGHFAKLIFCAKEATYKAQYTRSRTLLEFHDITLSMTLTQNLFAAEFCRDVPGFRAGQRIGGQFALVSNTLVAGVEIRQG